MKTISIIILILVTATAALAGPPNIWTPGGLFNPYVIERNSQGQAQITSQFPDLSKPLMAPGQPFNPYIVRPQPNGDVEINTDYPGNYGDNEGDD